MNCLHTPVIAIVVLMVSNSLYGQESKTDRKRDNDNPTSQRNERSRRDRGNRVSPLMAALDTDRDGTLSAEEIAAAVTSLKKLDKNNDGMIQLQELQNGRNRDRDTNTNETTADRAAAFVQRTLQRDQDGDGKVSKEEAGERMANIFDRLDSNQDGFLSEAELKKMAARFQRPGGPRGNQSSSSKAVKPKRPKFDNE